MFTAMQTVTIAYVEILLWCMPNIYKRILEFEWPFMVTAELILGLPTVNERRRYFVPMYFIGWVQG